VFLVGGITAAGALASPFTSVAASGASSPVIGARAGGRFVVLGAGFAGITAALTVKRRRPRTDVVLVERAPYFVSAPGSLRYLFDLVPFSAIARSYTALRQRGLRVVDATVQAIDPPRKCVLTSAGLVEYDYLVIATGLRPAREEVPGLSDDREEDLCFFHTGPSLADVHRRIAAFAGGRIVVATPVGAYKCPPAPYEYALLWADLVRRRGLRGHVTLIDPRPKPTPLGLAPGLLTAMASHGDRLRYEPFTRLVSVNPEARTVETDAGKLPFDLLSVVAPNVPMAFISEAGLGHPFVPVEHRTFQSIIDPSIFAVGDTAETAFPKTASAAITTARLVGQHVAHALGAPLGEPEPPINVCFPLVSAGLALRTHTMWSYPRAPGRSSEMTGQTTNDNQPSAVHVGARGRWEAAALRDLFGR
jgi:sulfide dehydrogenase [flavocytochrome c] flavoprotein chain